MAKDAGLSVGELRAELEGWPDDARVYFGESLDGGRLIYLRFKDRSSRGKKDLLHIELMEEKTIPPSERD